LGKRSANCEGVSTSNGSHAKVKVLGPLASNKIQVLRRPSSSQVPSTKKPPGARREVTDSQAAGTWSTSYWRKTLKARTSCGRELRHSNPRSSKFPPSRGGKTRSGLISNPVTRTFGFTVRSQRAHSAVVVKDAP